MTHTTEQESALADLRHMYAQMVGGMVKDSAQAKRIADGILSRAIQKLEQAARRAPVVQSDQLSPDAAKHAMEELQTEVESLRSALAECRDACPIPTPGASNEEAWMQSIGDPESVPAFVKSCLQAPVVPLSATHAMIEAAESVEDLYKRGTPETWGKVWHAMLAAAPQPPEAASTPTAYRADVHKGECIDDHCPGCREPAAAPDLEKLTYDVLAKRAEAAPVQLPSPIGVVRVFEPNENSGVVCTEVSVNAGHLAHGWHLLYTEHQVRQLLAAKDNK